MRHEARQTAAVSPSIRDMWASSARCRQTVGFGWKSPVPARNKLCLPARLFPRAFRDRSPPDGVPTRPWGVYVYRIPASGGVVAGSVCVDAQTPPSSRHAGPTCGRWAKSGVGASAGPGRPWANVAGRTRKRESRSCVGLCKPVCKRTRGASKVARFTGLSIGSPGVPKLNVGSSILLARFDRRRCHRMTPAAFR